MSEDENKIVETENKIKNYFTNVTILKSQISTANSALVNYNSLLKNDPSDPFYNYYYGICLLELNKNKVINNRL